MQIGNIEAEAGEYSFGYLDVASSRSGLSPDIPVHLFVGEQPGPTLLVQGAIHGSEIIGSMGILNFVDGLDPEKMQGNIIAVPVVNRMGFELMERGSKLDGKDISREFPGDPEGSVSEQVAYTYFEEVIKKADVMIDLHAGGQTAYERYVLFTAEKDPNNLTEIEKKRRKLVVAFGLDSAAYFPPGTFGANTAYFPPGTFEATTSQAIEEAGVAEITVEFGGGTGWHKNGEDNVADAERGLWNTAKAMDIVEGEMESDGPKCEIYKADVVLWKPGVDGLFIRKKGIGDRVEEGEIYASLVDPYTGETLADMRNEQKDATVIPSGQNWPTIGSTSVGILGNVDRVEDRREMDFSLSF